MRTACEFGLPALVLFDRDGTLIRNEPELRRADQVVPMPGAREAARALHAAGIRVGVVTNQPRLADGSLSLAELERIHARVEELVGPIAVWAVCPHAPGDGCACRKPQPGGVERALRETGVAASACVMVGDIGSDVDAARAAGARAVLVPTPVTLREEIERAPAVAPDLERAVEMILARCV